MVAGRCRARCWVSEGTAVMVVPSDAGPSELAVRLRGDGWLVVV